MNDNNISFFKGHLESTIEMNKDLFPFSCQADIDRHWQLFVESRQDVDVNVVNKNTRLG
jgi:hypothetical protein